MNTLCIRHETKSAWERRAPLAPAHVDHLITQNALPIAIQPSDTRIFPNAQYTGVGAVLQNEPNDAAIVMGVKEMPVDAFAANRAYVFFSHTMKGQPANMPALKRLLELGCTLIDYELITDNAGKRLVAFGPFAGVAGAIDTLWTLGRRLAHEGIESPISNIKAAHQYPTIEAAELAIREVGDTIRADGLPSSIAPLTVGVLGYGGVASGAMRMLDCLPIKDVSPSELESVAKDGDRHTVFRCVFREEHLVSRTDGGTFVLDEYYQAPDNFEPIFAQHLAHLSILINCIYWDERYPRFIARDDLKTLFENNSTPRLRVIGDITCDVDGSLACTTRTTTPDAPVYVYNPLAGTTTDGIAGLGTVVLAVDFLPCEVPYDATMAFSQALSPFIPGLLQADLSKPLAEARLPPELERAVICYRGDLVTRFKFLANHI